MKSEAKRLFDKLRNKIISNITVSEESNKYIMTFDSNKKLNFTSSLTSQEDIKVALDLAPFVYINDFFNNVEDTDSLVIKLKECFEVQLNKNYPSPSKNPNLPENGGRRRRKSSNNSRKTKKSKKSKKSKKNRKGISRRKTH